MLRPGERVGDWIIEAPLGEGGMGAVYRVHSALTQRLVAALKVMKPTADPDARARFVREAEALSALRHPAVVRVMGFSEDRDRDLLYLVMERAVGAGDFIDAFKTAVGKSYPADKFAAEFAHLAVADHSPAFPMPAGCWPL